MKTMKAAIVKEDGLIYVNEVPEEPKFGNPLYEGVRTELIRRDYQRKLASAMDSSIFVSDQEKASKIIIAEWMRLGGSPVDGILPGIYPIPDLQWEVKEHYDEHDGYSKVAILKESTSTKQESQEDHIPGSGKMVEDEQDALWWKVFYVLEFSNVDPNNGIEELKRHFTINRKP